MTPVGDLQSMRDKWTTHQRAKWLHLRREGITQPAVEPLVGGPLDGLMRVTPKGGADGDLVAHRQMASRAGFLDTAARSTLP